MTLRSTATVQRVSDLVAAAGYLRQAHRAPALLIGHSLGAAAVLAAAGDVAEVKAIATIGAPSDTQHVTGLFRDHLAQIEAEGEAQVMLAQLPDQASIPRRRRGAAPPGQGRCPAPAAPDHALAKGRHVEIANAARIFTAAKHPKSFVSLDDADTC